MQNVQAAVPGLPIRRSACDRCKSQKLRCLKEPGEDRCYRCTRADAQCATTANVPIRSRRRIGGVINPRAPKRMRQDDQEQATPTANSNQQISAPLPVFIETSSNVQSTVTYAPEAAESWGPNIYESMFGNNFDGDFASLDVATNKGYLPYMDYQPEMRPFSNFPVNASPSGALSLPGTSQETVINTNTPASPKGSSPAQDSIVEIGRGISESDTHRLAKINLDLAKLLGQIGRGSPEINFYTLLTPIDKSDDFAGTPVHKVLGSSREFIEVICGLSDANKKTLAPISSSHGSSPRTPESRSDSSTGSSTSGYNSPHSCDYGRTQATTQATPLFVSMPRNGPKRILDSTTLMHILISYTHIIQLHLIIFTHCYEALLEISKSDVPSMCELPWIDFGSFPLQSGNLQATLFTQVIISLFEKIENLLGIPQEFQLTPHKTTHAGLLSEPEFSAVLRAILVKEELMCKPDVGKGGISALRRYINQTRQLLRDSIEP
ncbi:hypothetical protein K445DRAFT_23380 [Daldinia sp. EC12]|nr:hypothetical protein K445DRAFT_23380 [Daldinia sp. EC12]